MCVHVYVCVCVRACLMHRCVCLLFLLIHRLYLFNMCSYQCVHIWVLEIIRINYKWFPRDNIPPIISCIFFLTISSRETFFRPVFPITALLICPNILQIMSPLLSFFSIKVIHDITFHVLKLYKVYYIK